MVSHGYLYYFIEQDGEAALIVPAFPEIISGIPLEEFHAKTAEELSLFAQDAVDVALRTCAATGTTPPPPTILAAGYVPPPGRPLPGTPQYPPCINTHGVFLPILDQ